jgi:hypothetical protein
MSWATEHPHVRAAPAGDGQAEACRRRSAALTVADRSRDAEDCALLLDVVGLVDAERRPVGWKR